MRLRDLVLDPWAPLSHKQPFARVGAGGVVHEGPSWLGPQDRRRLLAYQMLRAYTLNVARAFIPEDSATEVALDDERREFGDPALVVKQTVAALLGQEQQITVPTAGDAEDDEPPADDETPDQRAEREALNAERAATRAAAERQEWLEAWADDERLPLKLLETERNAVNLGDGVYLIVWNGVKRRPSLTAIDPGFYFPVLPEGLTDDYPSRVHLAWEVAGDPERNIPTRLRRVTYELGPIEPAREATLTPAGQIRRLLPFLPDPDLTPTLLEGDTVDSDGRIVRRYPWQSADEDPSDLTCYVTEAEWDLDEKVNKQGLYDLDLSAARIIVGEDGVLRDHLDLRHDFLPVIHIPNTVALSDHFGESTLSPVLQLLDEVQSSDTDEAAASATTGNPPIGVSGVQLPTDSNGEPVRLTMGPGEVWGLGADGRLSTVDTSAALGALAQRIERLLDRLQTNVRLPGSVLGRSTEDSPSGFHLLLTFGPLTAMVRELRLARQEKYALLLRFAQRLAMVGGALPPGEVYDAEVAFGSYLPTDLQTLIGDVVRLYSGRLVSLETALAMLRDGGLPIEDIATEVERIQARDTETANGLADALNDPAVVRDYLGVEPPPDINIPTVELPPVPPATPPLPPSGA